jgi:type IV pilus assembly protein PilM
MHVFGFHWEGQTLKVAILSSSKKKIVIEHLEIPLLENPIEQNVKQVYISHPAAHKKNLITVSGLDSWEVLLRELDLGLSSKKMILDTLPFQMESVIPYPPEELILLPFLDKAEKNQTSITLLAAKKSLLEDHIKKCISLEMDPDYVSSVPTALSRFAKYCARDHSSLFLFHLGLQKSSYSFISNNQLKSSQTLFYGLQDFINALTKDLPGRSIEEVHDCAREIDLFSIDKHRFPALDLFTIQFQKDLDRISSFLRKKSPSDCPFEFLYSGDLQPLFNFKPFLERYLGPSIDPSPFSDSNYDFSTLQSYAVPIGLCLDVLSQDKSSVQFRRGSFIPARLYKKRFKQAAAYCSLCMALTALSWFSIHFLLEKKEGGLQGKLQTYLDAYSEVKPDSDERGLEQSITAWEQLLSKQKRPFPYVSSAPQVSDFLVWLSAHPKLNLREKADQKEEKIEIKHVHYSLTKYPKAGENFDPYQAKIDLEFTSESPRLAREFHDALMAGDSMVNPKSEISWSVHQNTYHTSFFLKSHKRADNK